MFGFLHTHSHYSLLRGVAKIPKIIEQAKEMGCDAIAITDTNNMYGAIEFYKAAKKHEIKAIFGTTLYIRLPEETMIYPIVLLAKTEIGYKNMLQLITAASFTEGKTKYITPEQLKESASDVIGLLPSLYSPVTQALSRNDETLARKHLEMYRSIFGDSFFVGISPQNPTPRGDIERSSCAERVVAIAEEMGIGIVPLPLVYLLNEEDKEAREVLLRIQKTTLSNLEEDVFEDLLLIPSRTDIEQWCSSVCPSALKTLDEVICSISWDLKLGNWVFPKPPIERSETRTHEQILADFVEEGYEYRNLERTEETKERVSFEMKIITDRGYTDYFLVVIDLIRYMRENGILTTTRGSAAGSFVSYLTGITNVDPIKYQLPFERFLNPFRPSPPDIDIDIADDRRGEVIDYMVNRYGKKKIAQIGTLGTMMARAAVRDTARALRYSYMNGDRIARLIPMGAQGAPMYIDKAMDEVKELRDLYDSEEVVRHIIDVAKKIEGNARHLSVHAAGVVISPTTAVEYTPLERDNKRDTKYPITQYNMHAVEDAGLLKFDILGLTNLAVLAGAIELVKKDKGEDIDIENIPLDNRKTYEMISKGYTTGVFQMGGSGMTAVLRRLQPTTIHDIAATVALYRPGPMRNIDEYIDRKQGKKSITYAHPNMEKFLKTSYGVLVYQDDLLYTAIEIAGYDWKEVDVFRKAVGKKIPELMAQQEKIFKDGAKKHSGMSDAQANKLWDLFDPFKGYGFNKSHAMCYAKVGYQTAYMKANYPAQYMTAHLSAAAGDADTVSELLYESKRIGLTVLPPNVNESEVLFSTEKSENGTENIRVGLATIKQVGHGGTEAIIEERNKNGKFTSIIDFLTRISSYSVMNRRNLEALIKVGVFDDFETRGTLLENIEKLLLCLKESDSKEEQHSLFDAPPKITLSLQKPEINVNKAQELYWEKNLLGMYVSGHPLDLFKQEGLRLNDVKRREKNSKVLTTAVISTMKPFRNRSGERMYFLTLEDDKNSRIEAVCFPQQVEEFEDMLSLHRPVKVRGSTSLRNDEITLRVDAVENPVAVAA